MECTGESVGRVGLDAVVNAATSIYAEHDGNRSLWDIWSHALHHAAAVAEEIRKRSESGVGDKKLKQEIADLALWLLTMLARLKGPLGSPTHNQPPQDWVVRISSSASDLMWNRYPGVCPWCYCATHTDNPSQIDEVDFWRPCRCDVLKIAGREKEPGELRARAQWTRRLAARHMNRRPQSLDCWQDMIAALYREPLTQASLAEVALHLLEEMGEASNSLIRMYTYLEEHWDHIADEIVARQIRLEDDLADVLSWLFGLVGRLDMESSSQPRGSSSTIPAEISNGRLLLSQILWARYGDEEKQVFQCWSCKNVICSCAIRPIQTQSQVEDLVNKLSNSPNAGAA